MKNFFVQKFEIYVRSVEMENLLEVFFVTAISSLLIVRAYLGWANYPTLGNGNFHIAHMLWGGFLMLVSIFILLIFLNRQAKHLAAFIGGIGFGVFIDELGKFITSDNNYFYQPTVAFIYVIFLLLFFAINAMGKYIPISQAGYAVNAIEMLKEMVLKDLDESERQKALEMLQKGDRQDPLVSALRLMLEDFRTSSKKGPGFLSRVSLWLKETYIKLTHTHWFSQGTIWFFAIYALVGCIKAIVSLRDTPDYADWGELSFSVIAFGFVVYGTRLLQVGHRLKAFKIFKYSVVISILFTQFFLFVKEQFAALVGLVLSLIVYGACQYLIAQEEKVLKEEKPLPLPASPVDQY